MRKLAATLISAMMLAGCGTNAKKPLAMSGLSGNWQMTLQSSTSSETQSGFLLQSGSSLTGSLLLSGQVISGQTSCAGIGSVQGQMNGSDVVMTVSLAGQTISLVGTPGDNSTSMSGTYSILASGCGQTETGTWTATQIAPLNGSFQATFTFFGLTSTFHFAGTISQAANAGESTAMLSGNMTSTDSPCFASSSIAGVITGTSVIINLLASNGESLGKYEATITADATSLGGTFRFSNASDPDLLGACQGLGGNATVTVQPSAGTT